MTEITINGTLALDQSSGLQDDDVAITTGLAGLSAAFQDFLANLAAVNADELSADQLNFADDVEAVVSAAGFVTVAAGSATVTDLFFSNPDGAALAGEQVFLPDGVTPLTTVDGENIYLWSFGDFAIATTSNVAADKGEVVAAFYLNETADHLSASIEYVTFTPLSHPVAGDNALGEHDDAIDWTEILNISAATELAFDFSDLPANQSLFGLIAADKTVLDGTGLAIIPDGAKLNADGSYVTGGGGGDKSATINTSKGGGPVTIAMSNQLFDKAGEGTFFIYVTDPDDDAVAGVGTGLSTAYDDADNLGFGGTTEVQGASYEIVQNSTSAKSRVTAYDIDPGRVGDPTADSNVDLGSRTFILDPTVGATLVSITAVRVYDENGNLLESVVNNAGVAELQDINGDNVVNALDNNSTVVITFFDDGGGVYSADTAISKKDSGYTIEFDTAAPHDMALVSWVAGTFDIGGFNLAQGLIVTEPVGDKLFTDDDGPDAALAATTANVVLDETDNDADDNNVGPPLADVTTAISTLFDDTPAFGTDGGKDTDNDGTVDDDAKTYSLVLNATDGVDSGLVDTLSGDSIFLFKEGADVVGRVGNDDGTSNAAGDIAFTVSLTNDPDSIRVIQNRAVTHDDPADPDEDGAGEPETMDADLVLLQVDVIDDDGDTDSATAELGSRILFEDDGPSIERNDATVPTLTTDDTSIADQAGPIDFSTLFTAAFGSDGFLDADDDDVEDAGAITYTLDVKASGVDSGLVDTLTNNKIFLFLEGTVVVGRVGNDDGTANNAGDIAISISVTADTGLVTFDQSRAVVHDDPTDPVESGASAAGLIAADLVTLTATATDGDLDTDSATAEIGGAFQLEDDGPAITAQISSKVVNFAVGASVSSSLNGDVGSDENAENDQALDGTKTYTFDSWTTPTNVVSGLEAKLSDDATKIEYFVDANGNDLVDAGELFYDIVLSQDGSGEYTFTVYQEPPQQFVEFDFTDLPANQSLFGLIAADKTVLDGTGLAIIPDGAKLNADGSYVTGGGGGDKSTTINTSKGGGPVTIAMSNQLFDKAGEGTFFIYVTDPDDDAVAGVGTGLSTAYDDADNLGFDGTQEVDSASYEIVQNSTSAKSRVTAYNIEPDPGRVGDPVTDTDVDIESRDFILDPTVGADLVSITAVRVYDEDGNLLESVVNVGGVAVLQDINGDNVVDALDNDATVVITFFDNGGGVYSADTAISKKDSGYTIEFDTAAPHDMALVSWVAGTFDIGGFNLAQGQDTPDQKFDFSVKITDFDLDQDGNVDADVFDDFSVGVDGTGEFGDGVVDGIA